MFSTDKTIKETKEIQNGIIFHSSNLQKLKNKQFPDGRTYVPAPSIYYILCRIMKQCEVNQISRNSTLLLTTFTNQKGMDYLTGISSRCFAAEPIFPLKQSKKFPNTLFIMRKAVIYRQIQQPPNQPQLEQLQPLLNQVYFAQRELPQEVQKTCQLSGFGYDPTGQIQKGKNYTISICAMIKNEAQYLLEWIAYHTLVGVDHFFIYNDNSTDETATILLPLIQQSLVTLHDVSKIQSRAEQSTQFTLLRHCSNNYAKKSKWLLVVDVDEFIVVKNSRQNNNLKNWIIQNPILQNQTGSITLPRESFAGNFYPINSTQLVTAEISWKWLFFRTCDFKSLSNTNGLDYVSIHYSNGFLPVRNSKLGIDCVISSKEDTMDGCRVLGDVSVFHYIVKSYEQCLQKSEVDNGVQNKWRVESGRPYCVEAVWGHRTANEIWQKDFTLANNKTTSLICERIQQLNPVWYSQKQICKDYTFIHGL